MALAELRFFFDAVPLNDPFGGWIQWNRVPPITVETVETVRGGASSLYGDTGLSGAINILPRKPAERIEMSVDVFTGSLGTYSGSGFLGSKIRGWSLDVNGTAFQTKGYRPVDRALRGQVDVFAGVRSSHGSARIERDLGATATIFLRPSYFGEVRTNGTGLQTNRTHTAQLVIGGRAGFSSHSLDLKWRAFGSDQVYDQVFSAINADRTAETLNRIQRVPARSFGVSGQASADFGDHTVLAGVEARNVRGASDEIGFAGGAATSAIGAGGRQTTTGMFAQDLVRIGASTIFMASVRYDRWNNYSALASTRTLSTGAISTMHFVDRTDDALSPQLSLLHHFNSRISVYASGSQSFRAPTLNELYRAFRVGSVLTTANEDLKAERALNVEAGIAYKHRRFGVRASAFRTAIKDPVANVTIAATPTLITRQRQNMGGTRSAGVEVEGETKIAGVRLTAGYLLAHSTVTNFPANPALVGKAIPQVARHQVTFQANYSRQKWDLNLQVRASSEQFDDDLNQFRLEPYSQVDAFISRKFREWLTAYIAVENIFNSRYSIARTPIRSVSAPSSMRVGLRWN